MDKEMYTKAANAKSAVELKAVAKEYGIELSDEKANEFYERLNTSSDLSEQELEQIAGGCTGDPTNPWPKPDPFKLSVDELLDPKYVKFGRY